MNQLGDDDDDDDDDFNRNGFPLKFPRLKLKTV
jgi:hypothetical protein